MKELLTNFARWPAANRWICFADPWLARPFGIPIRAAFWRPDRQSQQLTRLEIVCAYGVLIFGIGLSIFNLDSDTLHRVLSEKSWSAKLIDLGFQIALSTFSVLCELSAMETSVRS
jgi:hypothetical protein